MARRKAAGNDPMQALDLSKKPGGALNLPPPVRKPSRGAMGGATPRSGRTRLPPELAPAGRGGKKTTPRRKVSK